MARGGALVLALVLLFATGFRSEKILSDMKRCGDPECESLMLRAQATRDYTGPDCRYLSFKAGQEILVYYKLSGKRQDLWQGSQGMKSGYFPKDAVSVEEVYLNQEMEVPSKETDFICLDGDEYIFENEDSVLHHKDEELDSQYHDTTPEGELLKHTRVSFQMGQRTDPNAEGEEEITAEKAPNIGVATSDPGPEPMDITNDRTSANGDAAQQEDAKETWFVSSFSGWLGLGGKQEEIVLDLSEEPLQENTFHSRKIALSNDLSSSEREEVAPSKSGWFQSRLTDYLPFVAKDAEQILKEPDKVSNIEITNHASEGESDKNTDYLDANPRTAEQEIKQSASETPKSSWISLGFDNVLNLGQIVRATINRETEQMEEHLDRGSLSESAEILHPSESESGKDQEGNLEGAGPKDSTMQNDQANQVVSENLHLEQTTPREINMSENYPSKKNKDDLVGSSWFNLGLDKMMSFRESQTGENSEEPVDSGNTNEPSHVSTSRDSDSGANLALADERFGSTVEHSQEDEARKTLKESVHVEDLPITSGWLSDNLENIMNLKAYTATDESLLSTMVNSKVPSSEADSVVSTAEGQMKESAETREILKAVKLKEDEPGWYDNMYGNLIGYYRHSSDSDKSPIPKAVDENVPPSLAPHSQPLSPHEIKNLMEQVQGQAERPPHLTCMNSLKYLYSAQSFTSKAEGCPERSQGCIIPERKSQAQRKEKLLQSDIANDLKLPPVSHTYSRSYNYFDLLKDTVSLAVLAGQTEKQSVSQRLASDASLRVHNSLPHATSESCAWQIESVSDQQRESLTHPYLSTPEVVKEHQKACQEDIVMDNCGDPLSKDQHEKPSESFLETVDTLGSEQITVSKTFPLGKVSDSETENPAQTTATSYTTSSENSSATSLNIELPEPDTTEMEDVEKETKTFVSEEALTSPPQFVELLATDPEKSPQCSALNGTFTHPSNFDDDHILSDKQFDGEQKQLLSQEKRTPNTLEPNGDEQTLHKQGTDQADGEDERHKTLVIVPAAKEPHTASMQHTDQTFPYDKLLSVHSSADSVTTAVPTLELLTEKQMQNMEKSEDIISKQNNVNIPYNQHTSLVEADLRLQTQPPSQHIPEISDTGHSLKNAMTDVDAIEPKAKTDAEVKSDLKVSVKRKLFVKEATRIKDACGPPAEARVTHSNYLDIVKSVKSPTVCALSLSEAAERFPDNSVKTSQAASKNHDNNNKSSKEGMKTSGVPSGPVLEHVEASSLGTQYAETTQPEEQDLESNISLAEKSADRFRIPDNILIEPFSPTEDKFQQAEALYNDNNSYFQDSLQTPVEHVREPDSQPKNQFTPDSGMNERSEKSNRYLDPETAFSPESQRAHIPPGPAPHIHDHYMKTPQNLEGLGLPNLLSVDDKQNDVPTVEYQPIPGSFESSEKTAGSKSEEEESKEQADLENRPDKTSVSPEGIMGRMAAKTSGLLHHFLTKSSEADYSRGSETKVNSRLADGASSEANQEGEDIDQHDKAGVIRIDRKLATTGASPMNYAVTQIQTHESVLENTEIPPSVEAAEIISKISLEASSKKAEHNKLLNSVDRDLNQLSLQLREGEDLESACQEHTLILLEQQVEILHESIATAQCVNAHKENLQETVSAADGSLLGALCKEWTEEKQVVQRLQNLLSDVRRRCAAGDAFKNNYPGKVPEKAVTESSSQNDKLLEQLNNRESEDDARTMVPTDKRNQITDKKTAMSTIQSAPPHRDGDTPLPTNRLTPKDFSPEIDFQFQHHILIDKNTFFFGIIQYLQAQNISNHMTFMWSTLESTLMAASNMAVKLLPEDLRPGPDLYGVCWEMVICAIFVGVFTVTVFLCQVTKAIQSRRYVGREKELASEIAKLMKSKCKDLEQLSIFQKQYDELDVSLKNASDLKEASEATSLEATCEKLTQSNSALSDEIEKLEKELQEEKSRRLQQDDILGEIQRQVELLEKEVKDIRSQTEEARTTLKVFQINKGRLETALQDAKEEHARFQESNKQLLQESEGWGERLSELTEQTKMFESSKQDLVEALKCKESQVKSLTDCLLTMKDWSTELGTENNMDNNNWEEDATCESENGKHLDDHQKRTVKKLIHAAKLNASLKTLEAERNQIYLKLADEVKAKEELAERIDELQREQNSLHSENTHFVSDVQNLQQKLKVMTEMYQENELKLHRKLTVEEKGRLEKEDKLSKVDEKIYHAAEELQTYKTRAKDLEEELEKTIRSYQSQICSHEKKGHDNWLTARAAERHLNDIKKENGHSRQKLTELQFNLELLEKDPYALEVPRGFARENSPFGPPPLGRPSPESRAFLSPPTLLEGPLRLSPMLPGTERAARSDNAEYSATSERAESGSDHQGANSDTGSLSPPWEREHRISAHVSGQHYPDPALLSRRHDRYYPNPQFSGRFSGPAELLRGYNMQSLEKSEGQLSEENSSLNEPSRNGADENNSNLANVDHRPHQAESIPVGLNFGPPPPQMRGPLMPMDPRGPFLRRMPPFPPRAMDMYGGPREYFPVPDFTAIPHHPMAMRNPFPARPFLPFLMQRPGFFPPPPDIRNESPVGQTLPPGGPEAEHPKPHQETEDMLQK